MVRSSRTRRFRSVVAIATVMFAAAPGRAAGATCTEISRYARSVVSLSWYYDTTRHENGKTFIGERATAWFFTSPRYLVTAAHFASELPLQVWRRFDLTQSSADGVSVQTSSVEFRVVRVGKSIGSAPDLKDDVAILELREPFPDAAPLDIQLDSSPSGKGMIILGYPAGKLQAATGLSRTSKETSAKYSGLLLLEVQGPNRLLLNEGASGAPVIDCENGRVVAVISGLLTGPPLPFMSSQTVPTPWGSPTNTAVPASVLAGVYE